MPLFGPSALDRHQDDCIRAGEATRQSIERLGDRVDRAVEKLEGKIDGVRQEAAQRAELIATAHTKAMADMTAVMSQGFRELWSRLWWMVGVSVAGVVTVLGTLAWHFIQGKI